MEISFYKKENTRDNYYVLYLFSCETQIAEIVGFLQTWGFLCVHGIRFSGLYLFQGSFYWVSFKPYIACVTKILFFEKVKRINVI